MSDTESNSSITSPELEKDIRQPSPVAVSEENLAALLRATTSSPEPHAARPVEGAKPAAVTDANESKTAARHADASRPGAVTTPPSHVMETRLALFASVKENRSVISRSGLSPETPVIDKAPAIKAITAPAPPTNDGDLSRSAPPKIARRQTIVPNVSPTKAPVAAIPASSRITPDNQQTKSIPRTRLIMGLIICVVVAALGGSIFLLRTHSTKTPTVAASAPKENVPLQVRVEPLGKGLIDVRWNPENASIAQARDGRLVITESGQKPRTLQLDSEQLKTGHLTYQSVAENIEFDLEIADRSGAVVKESVMALQSPVSAPPPAAAAPPPASHDQLVAAKAPTTPIHEVVAEVPQVSPPSVRTFVPPPAQQKIDQRAIVDAPPALTSGPVMLPDVKLSAPLPTILPPPTKDAVVQQQIKVESNVQAANLIKKVLPIYPHLARSTRIQGTVRFTAHIGKDGRILNLKFASGPPVLVDSAATAVKQWVYRPTLLNGVPVEVITQIDVNFTLSVNAR